MWKRMKNFGGIWSEIRLKMDMNGGILAIEVLEREGQVREKESCRRCRRIK